MANNIVIIYKSANSEQVSPGQVVTAGEGIGFDTLTERWYFGSGLPNGYKANGTTPPQSAGTGTWICLGPSDVERLPGPGNPIIATITWRGLITSDGGVAVTETRGIRETTYESITGIPGAPAASAGRLLDQTVGVSLRAVTKNPDSFRAPLTNNNTIIPGIQNLPSVIKAITVVSGGKTYTHPNGWICYNWQKEEPLKGIFLVSAEYRYENAVTFGT